MTKEEKIKEEYLKLGLPFNENIIFDNGWLKIKPGLYSSKYDDLDLICKSAFEWENKMIGEKEWR